MSVTVPSGRSAAPFRRRRAKSSAVRVLAILSVFIGLLAAAAVFSRDWTEFLQVTLSRQGQGDSLRVLDPGADFAQKRLGHMLFPSPNSDICKRMQFDNRTGTTLEAGQVTCGLVPETPPDQIGQERAQQMLRAFRK
jgi:hypothetical protein